MSILNSAADVLKCFNEDCTELTVTATVEKLGIPKSNASRLLRAMRDAGFLENIGSTTKYRPGPLLLSVASTYRLSSTLIQRASEVVARVSQITGHTGYVSRLVGNEITAATDHPGSRALRVVSNIGRRAPAYATSTGRALLARLSDDEIANLYPNGIGWVSSTAPKDIKELLERVATVRREGVSTSSCEATAGADAIAVAVGDPETKEVVSGCIVFPHATVDLRERQQIISLLVDGFAELSILLGDKESEALIARREFLRSSASN